MTRKPQQSAVVGISFRRDQLQRIAEIQRLWEARTGAWTLIGDLVSEAVDQYIGTGCPRVSVAAAAFPTPIRVEPVPCCKDCINPVHRMLVEVKDKAPDKYQKVLRMLKREGFL
jgi:hypothetical protein